jgi:hypothetical protein
VTSRLALIAGLCLGLGLELSACSTPKIWPFYKKPKPVPAAVHEVDLVNADGRPATYPLDLELAPSVFRKATGAIYISWGSMPQFAEAATEAQPGFVSPMQAPVVAPAPAVEQPAGSSASEIIPPAEATPAKPDAPQSPPGS